MADTVRYLDETRDPPPEDDDLNGYAHDYQAEALVLGSILRDPTQLEAATSTLTADDFWRTSHRLIFDAVLGLYSRGLPVDTTTVANHLGRDLPRAGGPATLEQLTYGALAVIEVDYYASIVRDQAQIRRLREYHQRGLQDLIIHGDTPADEMYARTTDHLAALPRGVPGVDAGTTHPWAPVNLRELRATGLTRPTATILTTSHEQGLIYLGRTHSLSGESTTGKTWVALAGVAQEIALGHPVLYVDFEDRGETLLTRLHDMGADPDLVDELVRYIEPDRALDTAGWTHIERAAQGCRLAVIDGVTEGMTMHGLSLLDNEDIATWYGMLSRRIAAVGAGVVEIDHVVKNADNRGRYAIGGAHKLNGITGCAYTVVAGKSFSVGTVGHSRLVVAKDRHGAVGAVGETIAEFHVTPDSSRHREALVWELTPSQTTFTTTGRPRLTGLMDKVSRFLEASPGTNQTGIIASLGGKEKSVVSAISTLIEEGYLRTENGPRNTTFHHVILPFREGDGTND